MRFNHVRPIYKSETEEKIAATKKYKKIYGEIIRQRKDCFIIIKETLINSPK